MAKTAGSRDVAPNIRGAFKRALLSLEAKGKPLSGMIEESLQNDFLNTLKTIAQFTPKEIEQTIERKRSKDDFSDEELLEIIQSGSSSISDGEAPSPPELH